jgi:hypothetical protein
VLLVATYRLEFQPPWVGGSQVTVIALNRLGRNEGATLGALPPDIVDEIVERTDGVPLFVEELTKAVVEAGADRGHVSISAVPASSLAVPATLHASLLGRLDRLGPAAKNVAQVGAAIGRDFSYELLAAAAQLTEPELQEALRRLVEAGLVFQRGMPPIKRPPNPFKIGDGDAGAEILQIEAACGRLSAARRIGGQALGQSIVCRVRCDGDSGIEERAVEVRAEVRLRSAGSPLVDEDYSARQRSGSRRLIIVASRHDLRLRTITRVPCGHALFGAGSLNAGAGSLAPAAGCAAAPACEVRREHRESPGRSLARQLLWTPAAPFFGGRGGPRPSEPLPPLVLFDLRRYRRSHDPLR